MTGSVIAIVGGGFCGVLSAVRLLEMGEGNLSKIILIEKQSRLGRGVAYGTSDESHLLNVPVGQMSAFSEDPHHFLRFVRETNPAVTANDFVPRKLYGRYIESLLDTAVRSVGNVEFIRMMDCATDIQPLRDGRVEVVLAHGSTVIADKVIVATGNVAGRNPFAARRGNIAGNTHNNAASTFQANRYINNPWAAHALDNIDLSQPVLLLGSGLTAIDMACSLVRYGFTKPIYMVSRHGLQALAHTTHHRDNTAPLPGKQLLNALLHVRGGLRALRQQVERAAAEGHDWRDVLARLRPHIPAIWQRLSVAERQRFLRHLQRYWDMHRHRLPPRVALLVEQLRAKGQLQQYAGRVAELAASSDHFHVDIALRHSEATLTLRVGSIVNCTGICTNLERSDDPLLANLRRRNLCTADELKLGIKCDEHYALVNAHGVAANNIYYVGPYLRAKFWEATAVPELREHVTSLVRQLVEQPQLARAPAIDLRIPA